MARISVHASVRRQPRLAARLRLSERLVCAALAALATFLCVEIAPASERSAAAYSEPARAIEEIADLTAERLALMSEVAAHKWLEDRPIQDEARERLVLERVGGQARLAGLDKTAVERLFAVQLEMAKQLQSELRLRWTLHGYDLSGSPRDLASELRPRIDAIGDAYLKALVLAEPILSDDDDYMTRMTLERAFAARNLRVGPGHLDALLEALRLIRRGGPPGLDSIRSLGIVRVALPGDYAPFAVLRDGLLTGSDVELAQRLARELGVELRFVRTSWPTLVIDLEAGRYDVALGGITITQDRARVGAYSMPYHYGGKTIITRCGEVEALDSLEELRGDRVRLIVNPGGTNERFLRERLPGSEPIVFEDNRGIPYEILAGRADAMITDDVEANLWQRRFESLCRSTQNTFTADAKAILMSRDPGLVRSVDDWLAPLVARGETARLLEAAIEEAARH